MSKDKIALDGKTWLQYSISIWSDIRKAGEENGLAHPAIFPTMLPERLIKIYSSEGDVIFDPFAGSGSTLIAAKNLKRFSKGIEPSFSAFESLRDDFQTFLRNNGKLRALFDIEEFVTEKRVIEELATIPGDSECKVFITTKHNGASQGHYHPKFYLFHNQERYRVIIGSSNFTLGGIKYNIE